MASLGTVQLNISEEVKAYVAAEIAKAQVVFDTLKRQRDLAEETLTRVETERAALEGRLSAWKQYHEELAAEHHQQTMEAIRERDEARAMAREILNADPHRERNAWVRRCPWLAER